MSYNLFKVGKIWHFRFQINGARVQRSTRERSRAAATLIAERAHRQAKLWARGAADIPTLRELGHHWIKVHEPHASAAHVRSVEAFCRLHLYALSDRLVDEIDTSSVEEARNIHLQTHAPASANQWLRILKLLCNWAVRRKVIPALPFTLKSLKVQKRPRAILSISLGQRWLDEIDRIQGARIGVRTAVRLMLGIGLREAETITAQWEWLDWDRQTYTPGVTKGREADPLPLPPWLVDYLRPLAQVSGPIVAKADGHLFKAGFTRNAILRANRAVGATHITPHRLRGTFATMLSEAGVSIQSVQRAMRHKSPMTTMAYLESNLGTVATGQRAIAEQFGFSRETNSSGEAVAKNGTQSTDQQ